MKKIFLLLLIFVLTFSASVFAFGVEINKNVEISTSQITLGAISNIKGANLSASQIKELEELVLAKSPSPGYQKQLTEVLVDLSIKNLGYKNGEYNLSMPKNILITRKSNKIKASEIEKLLREHLIDNLDFPPADIIVESAREIKDINVAAGSYELNIQKDQTVRLPQTNLAVDVIQNGKKLRTLYFPVKITLKINLYTAKRDIARDSALNRSDFKVEKKEVSGQLNHLIRDWEKANLDHKVLSKSLNKGEILKSDMLKAPVVISWGDKVYLNYQRNNINISTFVTARGRGKVGDIITVENINSGYRFQAEIISSNEVKIASK